VDLPSRPIKGFPHIQVNEFLSSRPFLRLEITKRYPICATKYLLPFELPAATPGGILNTILNPFVSNLCTSMYLRLNYLALMEQGGGSLRSAVSLH
jgi:hypothetical protein